MKTQIVKSECAGVFPLLGSTEESRSRKIRVSKNQPYTLALVGFRLTPQQAIDHATNVLTQAKAAASGDKRTVLDILARRKDGESVLTVQTAIAPPEKRVKKPAAKAASTNGHATAKPRAKRAPRVKHQPTPVAQEKTSGSEAAA